VRICARISLNSVGALILSRMADRMGRRRIVLLSLLPKPLCSLAAAISTSARLFIIFELIIYYAGIDATFGSSLVMLAEALPIEKRSEGQGWANPEIAMGSGGGVILAPILARCGI
jgi:MFS transporter, putative metabolite:H+ symporter